MHWAVVKGGALPLDAGMGMEAVEDVPLDRGAVELDREGRVCGAGRALGLPPQNHSEGRLSEAGRE
jgi:hypothetical protein